MRTPGMAVATALLGAMLFPASDAISQPALPLAEAPKDLQAAVDKTIRAGMDYLYSRQNADGSWGAAPQEAEVQTPAAAYALLDVGVSPQDPRLDKALLWMCQTPARSARARALRCLAWARADRSTGGKYAKFLDKDLEAMIKSLPAPGGPVNLAELAWLSAGIMSSEVVNNAEIPSAAFRRMLELWQTSQGRDGSWTSQGSNDLALTAAGTWGMERAFGLAHLSTFVRAGAVKPLPQARQAEQWMRLNFKPMLAANVPTAERVDSLFWAVWMCGEQGEWTIDGEDVGRLAAREILRMQGRDGAWGGGGDSVPATAQALAVLSKMKEGFAFTHLRYEGDWNNRPHAVANLTRWMTYHIL